jgi:TolB protein
LCLNAGAGTIRRMIYRHGFILRYRLRFLFVSIVIPLILGCSRSSNNLPPVLFLRPDDTGRATLFILSGIGDEARPLVNHANDQAPDIIDFAVGPDGRSIAYSAFSATGGTEIRIIDANGSNDRVLLTCPTDECSDIVWTPDGSRLVYERRVLTAGRAAQPRLSWLDPADGETQPLISGNNSPSFAASFSPDGRWISYFSPNNDGIVLYNLLDGRQRLLPSRVGRPAVWSLDSTAVIISDLVVDAVVTTPYGEDGPEAVQESAAVYLYRVLLSEEGSRQLLSPEANIEDSAPAWSPDGRLIAFGRRPAATITGRQLWLMRPDGTNAQALTNDPNLFHGPPAWSPDGRFLLFQRFDLARPSAPASVWLLELETGAFIRLSERGFQPAWLTPATASEQR